MGGLVKSVERFHNKSSQASRSGVEGEFTEMFLQLLSAALVAQAASSFPATYDAASHTQWTDTHKGSRAATIFVDLSSDTQEDGVELKRLDLVGTAKADAQEDWVKLKRLDLVGSAKERGEAQGLLLASDLEEFLMKLDQYFKDELLNLDISSLPAALQALVEPLLEKGAEYAPDVFWTAMGWVWRKGEKLCAEQSDELRWRQLPGVVGQGLQLRITGANGVRSEVTKCYEYCA